MSFLKKQYAFPCLVVSFCLVYSEVLSVCGVLGLLLHDPCIDAATEISEGLALLQHRGQDACGIITCGPKGRFFQCKANGLVRDVFDEKSLSRLVGGMGVGHGQLISCLSFDPSALPHLTPSPLSNRRNVQPRGGPALLRQFTIWNRVRPCERSRME